MRTSMLTARSRRGSALMLALVTALILSVVAIGLAYFSSTEDRISGNDKLQKQGFYAAETGIRLAETLLNGGPTGSPTAISTLLTTTAPSPGPTGSPSSLDLHDNGYQAVLLVVGGTAYRDQALQPTDSTKTDRAFYSIYVRNDLEDDKHSATEDSNRTLNVISVGYIDLPGGGRITKIIEEQIDFSDTGSDTGGSKDSTPGGTNT